MIVFSGSSLLLNIIVPMIAMTDSFVVPFWLMAIMVVAFYTLQCSLSFFFALYIASSTGVVKRLFSRNVFLLSIPLIVNFALIAVSIFTKWVFVINKANEFYFGPYFLLIYIAICFYFIFAVFCAIRHRKDIGIQQFLTMMISVAIIVLGIIIQRINPTTYLIGTFSILSLMNMYFSIQRPFDMVNPGTGMLNYVAMVKMVSSYLSIKKDFQIIVLDLVGLRQSENLYDDEALSAVRRNIAIYLSAHKRKANIFYILNHSFVIITTDEYDHNLYINYIGERFKNPWNLRGKAIHIPINLYVLSNSSFIARVEDIRRLIDYAIRSYGVPAEKPILLSEEVFCMVKRERFIADALRVDLEERRWLELYFQPVYCPAKRRFTTAEALLRFHHPDGSISPAEFIPVAERSGLLSYLNTFVLESVAALIREHSMESLGLDRISINLSGTVFADREVFVKFLEILTTMEIPPSAVCFEITESIEDTDFALFEAEMNFLRKMGFTFALDDFGTGFSNMTKVLNLPFELIKIDRSILYSSRKVFSDTLSLLSHAGCEIVAEGVETVDQASWLKGLEIAHLQGFFFALPMPASEFVAFLGEHGAEWDPFGS